MNNLLCLAADVTVPSDAVHIVLTALVGIGGAVVSFLFSRTLKTNDDAVQANAKRLQNLEDARAATAEKRAAELAAVNERLARIDAHREGLDEFKTEMRGGLVRIEASMEAMAQRFDTRQAASHDALNKIAGLLAGLQAERSK